MKNSEEPDEYDSVILNLFQDPQCYVNAKPWIPGQARNDEGFPKKSIIQKGFYRLFPLLCGTLFIGGCTLFDPAPAPECTACMAVTIAPPPGDRSLP